MKFINYLQSISGVGIFPLISLIMFFVFFAAVAYFVIRVDKTYIKRAKQIPISNDTVPDNDNQNLS
ncbi:MAG TPA: CcoQ/FixQ family Cbb3-type cytochrome c oxidase assembly chaperone [Bacteroidia bacterium]|nr:CcoQ/FixQ family Cbb3-type cytochrome c oxidase assembly chaperone [Bacteroidia bacterium]